MQIFKVEWDLGTITAGLINGLLRTYLEENGLPVGSLVVEEMEDPYEKEMGEG
jgi:hypothetical protein